jgi:transposase-like protein
MEYHMGKRNQRHSAKVILGHLEEQTRSREKIEEYCRQRSLTPSTFYNWKRRYKSREASATALERTVQRPIGFRQVGIATFSDAPFRIHWYTAIIEVPQQFDGVS